MISRRFRAVDALRPGSRQERGLLPKAFFIEGLKRLNVSEEAIQSLVAKVVHEVETWW